MKMQTLTTSLCAAVFGLANLAGAATINIDGINLEIVTAVGNATPTTGWQTRNTVDFGVDATTRGLFGNQHLEAQHNNESDTAITVAGLGAGAYDVYAFVVTLAAHGSQNHELQLDGGGFTTYGNTAGTAVGTTTAWQAYGIDLGSTNYAATGFTVDLKGTPSASASRKEFMGIGYAKRSIIASFDLNDAGDLNDNQTGWVPLNADLTNDSATDAGITLEFTNTNAAGSGRDRGTGGNVGTSALPNVHRDFTFADTGAGESITVDLSGLLANTAYELRWYHFENSGPGTLNRTAVYQDSVASANLLFESGVYDAVSDPDLTGFTDFVATSDALGNITLVTGVRDSDGGRTISMLNGFQVIAAIPTPSALPAGLALLGLAAMRRRR